MKQRNFEAAEHICRSFLRFLDFFILRITMMRTCRYLAMKKRTSIYMSDANPEIVKTEKIDDLGGLTVLPSKRVGWVDLIRVVSVFLVVVIHVTDGTRQLPPGRLPDSHWLFVNFFDTFFRCAVPLFFMISGYLILNKSNSLKHGFFKRLVKIGFPLLVWSIIYLFVRYWYHGVDLMGNTFSVYNCIRCILTDNSYLHLWFLYAILSLYIAAPILRSYLKSASQENQMYFLLLWGCACFLWPIISYILRFLFDIDNVRFDFYVVSLFVGYFVAGYYVGQRTISPKICFLCLISLVIIAVAFTWVGFHFSDERNFRWILAENYFRIPIVLMSFAILKYIGDTDLYQQSRLAVAMSHLAHLSFGIFLVHYLVMGAASKVFSLNIHTFDPWFSIPLTAVIVFALSALMVWMLQKLPLARWILP